MAFTLFTIGRIDSLLKILAIPPTKFENQLLFFMNHDFICVRCLLLLLGPEIKTKNSFFFVHLKVEYSLLPSHHPICHLLRSDSSGASNAIRYCSLAPRKNIQLIMIPDGSLTLITNLAQMKFLVSA